MSRAAVRLALTLAMAVLLGTAAGAGPAGGRGTEKSSTEIAVAALPSEVRDTLALIRRGGPFHYRQDGSVFGNRERRLPAQERGYYREYTVPTPGAKDRGARRIVAGAAGNPRSGTRSGTPSEPYGEYYYSDDHYQSFRRIRE